VAQYLRLRAHIPTLYGLLSVNAAALAYTHRDVAPAWLALYLPCVLIAASLLRMFQWMQPIDPDSVTAEKARRAMRRTVVLSGVMSFSYLSWALMLDRYGGPYEQGHVTIFAAVTVLGCVFCLNALPQAAMVACSTVIGPFLIYCIISGGEVRIATALNIALVTAVLLKLLKDSFDAFVRLETVQCELMAERRQAQVLGEENAQLARTDPLTGLPNRRQFFAVLDEVLEACEPHDTFCVGVLDLDRFKPVNDTHGHAQGDRLLQEIAERASAICPESAIVARLGGDEFGLIARCSTTEAEALANALCETIRSPVRLNDTIVSVGCSAGLASFPVAGQSANILFDRADFALYHAKRHRRGKCVHFSDELERLIRTEQSLDAALQSADLAAEVGVVLQPIFRTGNQAIESVECLARWNSPKLGPIGPEQLIEAAERVGRARAVTLTLFGQVLHTLGALPSDLRVTFNLSAYDVGDTDTISALIRMMAESGADAARMTFEITETSLISDLEAASVALQRLRQVGAQVALDDFGTGYSSLSSLHRLPLDAVKIDRSFASRLDDPGGRQLINAIHAMARSLDLKCVIEGIETEAQLLTARILGFTLAQGYFLAQPMDLDALLELVSNRRKTRPDAA